MGGAYLIASSVHRKFEEKIFAHPRAIREPFQVQKSMDSRTQ